MNVYRAAKNISFELLFESGGEGDVFWRSRYDLAQVVDCESVYVRGDFLWRFFFGGRTKKNEILILTMRWINCNLQTIIYYILK